MRKLFVILAIIVASLQTVSSESKFRLWGRVRDAVTGAELTESKIYVYDSGGNIADTIPCQKGKRWTGGETIDMAYFIINVEPRDTVLTYDVECEGYKTESVVFKLTGVKKRETFRDMPVVLMSRAPHKLGEVTVTATKIKFYNRGDTVVYNADAFQLAEGSMLDGLIAQMPGAELSDDGQIKVNGQFVESLLLDGKKFFDGNNQLMLENIAAYTVKNIEVYEGEDKMAQALGDPKSTKKLTMNVKLKKEYNMGWLINMQGGAGTDDRYSGRLFASWFNPTTRVTFLGNINNLNDNRKPGRSDTWTPEMMPSGTKVYKLAGVNYNYESLDEKKSVEGSFTFDQTSSRNLTTTSRTNFLQSSRTWDNVWENAYNRLTQIETNHQGWYSSKNFGVGGYVLARYKERKNNSGSTAVTFDTEQEDVTLKMVEALYGEASAEVLESVINRSISRSDASSHDIDLRFQPQVSWKIPGTGDRLGFSSYWRYYSRTDDSWKDYNVNYGSDPAPSVRRRQYTDNTPNHTFVTNNDLTYRIRFNDHLSMMLSYSHKFTDETKDSYMYALDRLADMGIYGVIPQNYLESFDPANSYASRLMKNIHYFQPGIFYNYSSDKGRRNYIYASFMPEFSLEHQHLDYRREGKTYLKTRSDFLTEISSYHGKFYGGFNMKGEGRDGYYMHGIDYTAQVDPTTPNLENMIDVVNDADPMNITLGNPDLKTEYKFGQSLEYTLNLRPRGHVFSNSVRVNYQWTRNALTRGFTYDLNTGVRHIRTYNVNGNSAAMLSDELKFQFGSKQQFTLASSASASLNRYADMIGTGSAEPTPSRVKNAVISEKLRLSWQLGAQTLSVRGDYSNRHTTSTQDGFSNINADHISYGVTGQFKLPAGLGLSTDFTLYTRRGYGVRQLDTTDAIWNLRLSYNPAKARRWVFMIDGFDMLHQLSNVNYAINASGRTVTYTNALPRYFMLSAQYRLNIQPKKR